MGLRRQTGAARLVHKRVTRLMGYSFASLSDALRKHNLSE